MNETQTAVLISKAGELVVAVPEALDRAWVASNDLMARANPGPLTLDFSATLKVDSAGIGFVRLLHTMCESAGSKLTLRNVRPELLSTLRSWGPERKSATHAVHRENAFDRVGEATLTVTENITQALSVLTEMLYWGTIGAFKRHDFRRGALGEQMYQLGFRAVGIVALLSLLIGLVLALQTALQLETYGAGVFLAPLIGKMMFREMGPLLTAIILAGRTGSATTAEIATMAVGEELDALQTMGINQIQFVVVPKLWAITLTMPLLCIISVMAGILGSYIIATAYLELAPSLFISELFQYLSFHDFYIEFIKSVVFSWLIIWIGSFYGFRARGGAEAVGRETTASVVTGIFIIIIADAVFSFIF